MNKHILIAAAMLAMVTGTAHAATATWGAIAAPQKVAAQNTATFKAGALGTNAVATIAALGAGISGLQVNDTIKITVAGAKFNRTNLSTAAQAAVTISPAATFTAGVWNLDATNTILTTTKVNAISTANTAAVITVVASQAAKVLDLTGVANGTKVTFTIEVTRDLLGTPTVVHTAPASPSVVVIDDLLTVAAVTKNTGTITVSSGFKTLSGTTSATTSQAATYLTVLGDAAAASATGTGLVTLSGDMSGVASITNTTTAVTACDATGAAKTVTAGTYFIDAAAGKAYGCYANAAVKAAATVDPIFTFDNTTAKATRTYGVTLSYKTGTSDPFSSFIIASQDLLTLSRDGSSFSVNSAGALNTVKITDMSGTLSAATGKISVVAYDAAGALAAGTAPVITALPKNGTRTIAMSTLTTAYPTAVRFDFTVESTQIIASNVKKSATGTTVTVYRNATSASATTVGNGAI